MLTMALLWLTNRWRYIAATGIVMVVFVLVALLALSGPGIRLSLLGNAQAPRPAAANEASGRILPRSGEGLLSGDRASAALQSSLLDQSSPSSAGPHTVAAAQSAWSADEIRRRESAVLAAVNCARHQQGQAALVPNPTLSRIAGDAWLRLVRNHSWSLMQLPGQYTLRSVMTLDFAQGAASPNGDQTDLAGDDACTVGGFDAGALQMPHSATTIGIAVFPPQATWDAASAVVLMQ